MSRIAECCCGSLKVEVRAEPVAVAACHCIDCQRRTGSVFGVGAYYPKTDVQVVGETKMFAREATEGRKVRHHFCPTCGTAVYWFAEVLPDIIGIAVGTFGDPTFPVPSFSIWEQSSHKWASLPEGLKRFGRGASSAPIPPT